MFNPGGWFGGIPVRVPIPRAEEIRRFSHGEVTTPDTLNFGLLQPLPGGLFCERIFGPVNDWECACRGYIGREFAGKICFTCQVEVAPSEVRQQRWGHIELPWPVCHPEYVRGSPGAPGPLAHWTGLEQSELEGLVYRRRYRVDSLDAGKLSESRDQLLQTLRWRDQPEGDLRLIEVALDRLQALQPGDWISREEMAPIHLLRSALVAIAPGEFERQVVIRTGAEAIRPLLALAGVPDRGRVTLECLPVIPAGLRDFRDVDQRRIAWHEVNELYRRVIHRNQRLRKLSEVAAPAAVLDAERQRLQELVDALIDNAHAPHPVLNEQGRPLRCLSDFAEEGVFEYGS
ncbi:MAG: hypothetical protein ACO1SX_00725 [Actinomycetota bacterium]